MRLVWIFMGLALVFVLPFLLWGDAYDLAFTEDRTVDWLQRYGRWAWAAGMILLASDLLLPIPATAVMAALGLVYGPVVGGLIAALGSFLSGTIAFTICRCIGQRGAVWLLGEEDLHKGRRMFRSIGGWLVALSRWLPVFPEVIACLAGLTRMPGPLFFAALACGSLPMGFVFAAVGHAGQDSPMLAVGLSAGLPPVLWFLIQGHLRRRVRRQGGAG